MLIILILLYIVGYWLFAKTTGYYNIIIVHNIVVLYCSNIGSERSFQNTPTFQQTIIIDVMLLYHYRYCVRRIQLLTTWHSTQYYIIPLQSAIRFVKKDVYMFISRSVLKVCDYINGT